MLPDARGHHAKVPRSRGERLEPTALTLSECDGTAIMGVEDHEERKERLELLVSLIASERDVSEGRVAPIGGTLRSLRSELLRVGE